MFQINIRNLVQNKLILAKNYHIEPSEIDIMQYYEYEIYLEEVNVLEKKQQEENQKQQDEYDSMRKSFNPNSFSSQMKQMQQNSISMPKMPSFGSGNFSVPKVSIPKF